MIDISFILLYNIIGGGYMKILNEQIKLYEMAYERRDAINRCADLGAKFVEHFDELYHKGINDIDFEHHCSELQAWWSDIKQIVLKHNKKLLSANQLIDWFFTKGSSVEILFNDEDEIDAYNDFMIKLISNKDLTVIDALKDILK